MIRSDLALAALASAAVPGMKPVAVAGLSAEEPDAEHQQAVVEDATGRRWLVRSPLTAVAGARLLRNHDLVRQLSKHVPFKVPAPVGFADVGPEGQAVVYPHVEGMAVDFARLPGGVGLAHAIGRAVAAIHNIPREAFEHHDVPSFDASGSRQRLIAEVDRAAETGRVPTRLLARWEEAFDAAPLWQFATTPVHGAFRGTTVLVAFGDDDATSGRVVAITDWEEAMVADPAVDLADLYARASPEAWESVLDSYGLARAHRPDPYLHARARLLSETRRLRGLARAVAEGDEDLARRAVDVLRRMDRLTEDDDSLVPTTAQPVPSGPPADVRAAGQVRVERVSAPAIDPDATAEVPAPPRPSLDSADADPVPAEPAGDVEDVEVADRAAESDTERLHEVYGMPVEEEEEEVPLGEEEVPPGDSTGSPAADDPAPDDPAPDDPAPDDAVADDPGSDSTGTGPQETAPGSTQA